MSLFEPPPKPENKISTTFRLRRELISKLDEIAQSIGSDRTYVLEQLVEWGHKEWTAEKKLKKK